MGYSVYSFEDGDVVDPVGGMTLPEAFTRMMALGHCGYRFWREGRVMRLEVMHLDPIPDAELRDPELFEMYFPDYRSTLTDDDMARMDIMRRFLTRGMNGYHITTDESFRQEEAISIRGNAANAGNPIYPEDMTRAEWRKR